ncbi:class I SAM-dependent methyltransferase [Micromonospora sp. WMMD736]|uniref:class I SAM-dependent methyltransferase n=1 Tax=Micromonospora sp. WMMD736 TaxID=3404112 RepID=UPI003B966FB4
MRTDNDSWDLASSVGATATMVATSRALATRSGAALINDPFAEPLVRAVGLDFFTGILDGEVPDEFPDYDPQRSGEQMAVRTRFFDDFFLNAVRCGVRQVVILASGLDTRAYRLSWPADTVVYEVDLPDVIEFKSSTLADLGAEPGADRRVVPVDLRDDWPAALRAAGFRPEEPTAWSAEGLLVYLPSDAQDLLFDRITALSAPGSQVATDFVPDMAVFSDGRTEHLRERWKDSAVSIHDLVYTDERNHVPDYLQALGWVGAGRTAKELYAVNGLTYPADDDDMALFSDVTYLQARLGG